MKKIIASILVASIVFLSSGSCCFAKAQKIKNFSGYYIKDHNIREVEPVFQTILESHDRTHKVTANSYSKNTYLYTDTKKATFYVRLYPADKNTNIYIVANDKYNVNDNYITQALTKAGYQYDKLKDKGAMTEYQFDFYALARASKLGTFFVTPDLIDPVKKGMAKLNNKMAAKQDKTSVVPYAEDKDVIKLSCLDTQSYKDDASGISILRKEYRPKEKTYKYMHVYEYVLTNNTDKNAKVTGTSERLAGMKDVTTETFIDVDRYNIAGAIGCLPPVLVCTFGLSCLLGVPSWIRYGTITKEAARYTHALPENYQLKAHQSMRVLVLKYKENIKPINFKVDFGDSVYNISY